MTKTTVTKKCEYCDGTGKLEYPDRFCPHCLGQGHSEYTVAPLSVNESFLYFAAMRYAINRQTYAGSIVIEELRKVLPRMSYADRKLLEKEIADALFKGEVDPAHKTAWEGLVTDIQRVEGA